MPSLPLSPALAPSILLSQDLTEYTPSSIKAKKYMRD
jgi:hypothetical protein